MDVIQQLNVGQISTMFSQLLSVITSGAILLGLIQFIVLSMEVWDGMDWIDLVQDKDQWRDLVHTVMNLRVP
jgi:hypothetical protein